MRNRFPSFLLRVAHVIGISVVRRSFIKKGNYISNFHAEFSVQFLTLDCTVCMRLTTDEAAQTWGDQSSPSVWLWIWASVPRNVLLLAGRVSLPLILVQSQQLIRPSTEQFLSTEKYICTLWHQHNWIFQCLLAAGHVFSLEIS